MLHHAVSPEKDVRKRMEKRALSTAETPSLGLLFPGGSGKRVDPLSRKNRRHSPRTYQELYKG